jgi:hypothetical protein
MFDFLILSACLWATTPDFAGDARYPDVRLGDAREFGISAREARAGWPFFISTTFLSILWSTTTAS